MPENLRGGFFSTHTVHCTLSHTCSHAAVYCSVSITAYSTMHACCFACCLWDGHKIQLRCSKKFCRMLPCNFLQVTWLLLASSEWKRRRNELFIVLLSCCSALLQLLQSVCSVSAVCCVSACVKDYSLVVVNADSMEYYDVVKLFYRTMTKLDASIVHIHRLQNPILWQFYAMFVLVHSW